MSIAQDFGIGRRVTQGLAICSFSTPVLRLTNISAAFFGAYPVMTLTQEYPLQDSRPDSIAPIPFGQHQHSHGFAARNRQR